MAQCQLQCLDTPAQPGCLLRSYAARRHLLEQHRVHLPRQSFTCGGTSWVEAYRNQKGPAQAYVMTSSLWMASLLAQQWMTNGRTARSGVQTQGQCCGTRRDIAGQVWVGSTLGATFTGGPKQDTGPGSNKSPGRETWTLSRMPASMRRKSCQSIVLSVLEQWPGRPAGR